MCSQQKLRDLPPLRILMLLTDPPYGGFGGISKFNQDFLRALASHPSVERVHAIPRIDFPISDQRLPECVVYDRSAARSKLAFLKSVWRHTWRPDRVNLVICGHIHLLSAAWLVAGTHHIRLALTIHGIEAWKPTRHKVANQIVSKVDSLVSVSRLSANRLASWSGFPLDRVFLLPNCVDLARFTPQPRDPALIKRYRLESSCIIMTTGRLESRERYKGFDEVIAAMPHLLQRFPTLKYLIVGEGRDRVRLEAMIDRLGIREHVIFTGKIPESEKVAHYNLADAYVMPSSGEGFGIVLIEAAACGLPVIGSLADGSQEALLGGRLGRLIDPRDCDALVKAVVEVLSTPTRVRSSLVDHFSEQAFQARVGSWLEQQASTIAGRSGIARR
jgi:phosphatidyl-myo-inositol dimannoside synthase